MLTDFSESLETTWDGNVCNGLRNFLNLAWKDLTDSLLAAQKELYSME
jgi:hypothetical protein